MQHGVRKWDDISVHYNSLWALFIYVYTFIIRFDVIFSQQPAGE